MTTEHRECYDSISFLLSFSPSEFLHAFLFPHSICFDPRLIFFSPNLHHLIYSIRHISSRRSSIQSSLSRKHFNVFKNNRYGVPTIARAILVNSISPYIISFKNHVLNVYYVTGTDNTETNKIRFLCPSSNSISFPLLG